MAAAANLSEPLPRLAELVAASPLEAAIYDGYGKALGQNAYNLLGPEYVGADWRSTFRRTLPVSISIATRCGSRKRGCPCITWWVRSIRSSTAT